MIKLNDIKKSLSFHFFSFHFCFFSSHNIVLIHLIHRLRIRRAILRARNALCISLANGEPPSKLVLPLALLDALELGQHLQAHRARLLLALGDERHRLLVAGDGYVLCAAEAIGAAPGDAPDGHQGRGSAGGKDLAKGAQLAVLDGPLVNLPAEALAQGQHAVRGDAVDDALGVGHDQRDVVGAAGAGLHADEGAGAELVNLLVADAVQVQRDAVALGARPVAPAQHRRVVAADFDVAGAVGRRAVEVVEDQALDGVHAVVDARGDHKDAERVLLGRRQAQLRAGAVDLRADVHGRARLVGRHKAGVQRHGRLAGLHKEIFGHGRHADHLGRVLHAHGVLVGAEQRNLVVAGHAKGLEALVGLLAVVERRRHAVDADEGVGDIFERRPLAGVDRVGRFDVAVDWKRDVGVSWQSLDSRRCRTRHGSEPFETHLLGSGNQHWTSQWC